MAVLRMSSLLLVAMLFLRTHALASQSSTDACITGCRIGPENTHGSVWASENYNYTVAIVMVIVYQSSQKTYTAASFVVGDPTEAFQQASRSIVALPQYNYGVFIVDWAFPSMVGTMLEYPSSDLRANILTAYSTFQTTSAECKTTSTVYTRDVNQLWEPIATDDKNWPKTHTGLCITCRSGSSSAADIRWNDMQSIDYASIPGLEACTTATMSNEPVAMVALVPVTVTTTEYVS